MSAAVRLARLADLDAIVALHLACFGVDDHLAVRLGARYVRAQYRFFIEHPRGFALVADDEGRIVGGAAVFDGPYTRAMIARTWGALGLAFLVRPWLVLDRELFKRVAHRGEGLPAPSGSFPYATTAQLALAMLDPTVRGSGLFDRLVDDVERRCRERGATLIGSWIQHENAASRRAFTKRGWREVGGLATGGTMFYARELA